MFNTANTHEPVDISKFTVSVSYGGQTKTLILQPLSENTANQYVAPILALVPGQYTLQLRGQLDNTDVSQDIQPEEVLPADSLAFPNRSATQAGRNTGLIWNLGLSI